MMNLDFPILIQITNMQGVIVAIVGHPGRNEWK